MADILAAQCETVVVCGRMWGGLAALDDRPGPGFGPMGGLCAALHHGRRLGAEAVLAAPCDLLGIPADVAVQLAAAPAVAEDQWLLGLWPADFAMRLEQLLRTEGAISARRAASIAGSAARPVAGLRNINRSQDLAVDLG